jgi:hypothetical protein
VYGVCIPMCVVYVWCVYIYPCKFMFVHMVSCVYNFVCRYTSVFHYVCISMCVFVYAILACVRWFLYWICDVCICVYMMWKYVCICMAFRVQVPTFTKFLWCVYIYPCKFMFVQFSFTGISNTGSECALKWRFQLQYDECLCVFVVRWL